MTRWLAIARKDYRAARGSRLISVLFAIFFLVVVINAYLFPINEPASVTVTTFVLSVTSEVTLILSLIGLLLGHRAIVSERAAGNLHLLLSLPYSRGDVLLGKVMGRAALLAILIAATLVLATTLVVYPFGHLAVTPILLFGMLTLAFGVTYLGIGIAISSVTTSEQRATAATFGVFFLFVLLWEEVPGWLEFGLAQAGLLDGSLPQWVSFVHAGDPISLYVRVVDGLIGDVSHTPWYMHEGIALAMLLLWLTVPLAVGYRFFEVSDL